MIRWHVEQYSGGIVYREGTCISTDTKPTDDTSMMNGSKLLEMDTATIYMYDEENAEWKAWD